MYGKIFDTIYDGTLVEDWRALVTFIQMIVLCDADGIIDMTPSAISRRTSIPIEHIKAGIEILENEDPYSRSPDDGGRRIVLLDEHRPWGWYIVNHEKYKGLQDSDTVRTQNRERKRKQRERHKASRPVTDGHASSRHTDTNTDTDTKTYRAAKRVPAQWSLTDAGADFSISVGMDDQTAKNELAAFRDCEFKNPRKDWDAAWRTWCRNWKKWRKDEARKPGTNEYDANLTRLRARAGLD